MCKIGLPAVNPWYARGTDAGDCYASLSRVKRGGTEAYHGYNKAAEPGCRNHNRSRHSEDQAMAPKKKPTSNSPAKKKKQRASKKPRAKAADECSPVPVEAAKKPKAGVTVEVQAVVHSAAEGPSARGEVGASPAISPRAASLVEEEEESLDVFIPDITTADRYRLCFQAGDTQKIHCGLEKFQSHLQTMMSLKYYDLLEKENNAVFSTSSVEAVLDEMMVKESIDMKPAARYIGRSMTQEESKVAEKVSTEGPLKHVPSWQLNGVSLELRKGFERYGVSLKNGWITVPVSGIYHVYSVADFYEDFAEGSPPEGFDSMSVMHAIFKYNVKEGVKKIVASEQPHMYPPSRRSFNMYSSFVNAFLNLKAGDQVGVKVSNLTMLRDPHCSCFGVYLI